MTNLGNAMQIIGDNIANVNTTAFKGSNYVFQDLLSQQIATQAGTAQVGRGMALGEVASVFEQGSFESTGNTTDLAIGGEGFFVLRESSTEQLYYSRAGNFKFNQDGVLNNSVGYVAQGWALDEEGDEIGSVTDIKLASFTSPPKVSENITMITNLDSDALSQAVVLANAWDSEETTPIDGSSYNYQSTVKCTMPSEVRMILPYIMISILNPGGNTLSLVTRMKTSADSSRKHLPKDSWPKVKSPFPTAAARSPT